MEEFIVSQGGTYDYLLLTLIPPHTASKHGVPPSKLIQETYITAVHDKNENITTELVKELSLHVQNVYMLQHKKTLFPVRGSSLPGEELRVGFLTLDIRVPGIRDTATCISDVVMLSKVVWSLHDIEDQDSLHVAFSHYTEDTGEDTKGTDTVVRVAFNVFGTLMQHYLFASRLSKNTRKMYKALVDTDIENMDNNEEKDTWKDTDTQKDTETRSKKRKNNDSATRNKKKPRTEDKLSINDILRRAKTLKTLTTVVGVHGYCYEDVPEPVSGTLFTEPYLISLKFQEQDVTADMKDNEKELDIMQQKVTVMEHGYGLDVCSLNVHVPVIPITRYKIS